jgi:hypothetical protein
MKRRLVALAVAACSLTACLQCGSASPERPAKLPASAFWCGGADGGVFVDIRAGGKPGRYIGTIYTEAGDTWYQGEFRVDPKRPAKLPKRGSSWCEGWDGTRLYVTGGGALIALDAYTQVVR